MAESVLEVTAVATFDTWPLQQGANKVVAVQTPDDDATTYLLSGGASCSESYDHDALPAEAGAIISVKTRGRGGIGGASTWWLGITDGVNSSLEQHSVAFWATHTTGALAVPVGGDWDVSKVNAIEVFSQKGGFGPDNSYLTSLRLEVEWTTSGGGLIIESWIPFLISSGLFGCALMSESTERFFSAIIRILRSRGLKTVPSRPEEFALIFEMLRRPSFCFFGR